MNMYAKVITDSAYSNHDRYNRTITIEATNPKFIDAEIEKHGNLRTNSSSSRAIPASKIIDQVRDNPYLPKDVRYQEKGMQGYGSLPPKEVDVFHEQLWEIAAELASHATSWHLINEIHKQHINRYLEPFTIQCKVITANWEDWMAMLVLRLADGADPNIQQWAKNISEAIELSVPDQLKYDEWHLPYVSCFQRQQFSDQECQAISVSQCASVSYYRQGNVKTLPEHKQMFNMLEANGHWSCFEHQLRPLLDFDCNDTLWPQGVSAFSREGYGMSGAFKRWVCLRNLLQG